MTLDRALSRAGIASRTEAAALIRAGRIQVADSVVRDPALWVTPAKQAILLDGQPLRAPKHLHWALHKPVGVITSHGDPQGRPTIYDLVGPQASWYFPVGRLDQDTSGLLLLTNDSVFAERIASPAGKVPKTYHVVTEPALSDAALDRLRHGLDIGRGERSSPAQVRRLADGAIALVLREGKNRQVRRMVEAAGARVTALARVRIGKLDLGDLPAGAVRSIRPQDVI